MPGVILAHMMASVNTARGEKPMEERMTITVTEAARILGISRGLAYQKSRTGEIPTIKVGRRLLVSRVALKRLLETCGDDDIVNTPTRPEEERRK